MDGRADGWGHLRNMDSRARGGELLPSASVHPTERERHHQSEEGKEKSTSELITILNDSADSRKIRQLGRRSASSAVGNVEIKGKGNNRRLSKPRCVKDCCGILRLFCRAPYLSKIPIPLVSREGSATRVEVFN